MGKIFAKNIGNRFSGKIIKKLCPESGLRIIRRILRIIAQSAVAGGSEVGAHYIKTKFLGSNEAHLYTERFLEFAAKALVQTFFNETCGEIIAFQMTENCALPATE